MADLGTAWAEIGDLRPLIKSRDFESTASARGGFFKNQRDVFTRQGFLLATRFFSGFEFNSEIDEVLDLVRGYSRAV